MSGSMSTSICDLSECKEKHSQLKKTKQTKLKMLVGTQTHT